MRVILKIYFSKKKQNNLIPPVFKRDTLKLHYKVAQRRLKNYNKGLKKIVHVCSIETRLTSYVFRQSFATPVVLKNISLAAISAMRARGKLATNTDY